MPYQTILTHLNDSRRARRLLEYAVDFAHPFAARVVGLHVSARLRLEAHSPLLDYVDVLKDLKFSLDEEVTHIRTIFEAVSRRGSFKGEFRYLTAERVNPAPIVMARARGADLVIVSQSDPQWSVSPLLDCSADLVLGSGRPVIVVPNDWTCVAPPKSVIIAWNQSREAARAMFDALPVLRNAAVVELLQVDEDGTTSGRSPEEDALPLTAVVEALAAHGVKPRVATVKERGEDIGAIICRHATNQTADLIVMGCYGHARLREMVFGGATRYLLRHMAVPVLFSH